MHILVVDDDPAVRSSLHRALRLEGYSVGLAGDGSEALAAVDADVPDVIVLDLMMPPPDGLEVCRRLRRAGNHTPILMLTAREAVGNRVEGLDAGADDYVVKPFALVELLARLQALLRRPVATGGAASECLRFADLTLRPAGYEAFRGRRRLELTRTEFLLLELFVRNPRQVLARSVILDRVWGCDLTASQNSLEVFISYLRRKLEAGGDPRLIQTVRGAGYALRVASDERAGPFTSQSNSSSGSNSEPTSRR
ncbi:MAG: response regulator transcription factor [Actinobacteria bacterium]|nr:MAG: response regulator transcription factor [Actinomycetota bacterium]